MRLERGMWGRTRRSDFTATLSKATEEFLSKRMDKI